MKVFETSQGFSGTGGTVLKSNSEWSSDKSMDSYGISSLPGGYHDCFNGYFTNAGAGAYWWGSSPGGGDAWVRVFYYSSSGVERNSAFNLRFGLSVCCLREAE